MGGVYGVSLMIDQAFFSEVVLGKSPTAPVLCKLGVHTVLILLYMAVALLAIRKRAVRE